MEFRHVVSVTGIGGLYQLLSTKATGAVIRNLGDDSTRFISARQHQVTPLESIEIYTHDENVQLYKVLEAMKEQDDTLTKLEPNKASTKELAAIFKQAVPEYDAERVYASDIKKIMKWYQILKKNDLLDFSNYSEENLAAEDRVTPEDTPAGDNAIAMVEEHEVDATKGESEVRPNASANKKEADKESKGANKSNSKSEDETEAKPKKSAAKKDIKSDDEAGPAKTKAKKTTK